MKSSKNIISAIGSFKGSIKSSEINYAVKNQLENEGHTITAIPVADGGDGLLDALTASMKAKNIELSTVDALGRPIKSKVSVADKTGIVEMALTSGLALLKEDELNPLKASTYGTGLLIKQLADLGTDEILLGIGGSATNDGGFGCLSALGFAFYDEDGNALAPCGENLQHVRSISSENVSENIKKLKFTIACDVTNPLLGENGATYVYGKQKGADSNALNTLEAGMKNYANVVAGFCKNELSSFPGTGAAGGLGFGLMALLGAKLQKGADIVLEKAEFQNKLRTADLVITGEGRLDNQTAFGKLPQIVAKCAKENGVKCIALCGSSAADEDVLKAVGIDEVFELVSFAPFDECMSNTEDVVKKAVCEIAASLI